MGERSVKLPPPLAEEIDKEVEKRRDEFGIPQFRSRAEFVEEACRLFLRQLKKSKEASS